MNILKGSTIPNMLPTFNKLWVEMLQPNKPRSTSVDLQNSTQHTIQPTLTSPKLKTKLAAQLVYKFSYCFYMFLLRFCGPKARVIEAESACCMLFFQRENPK